MRIIAYFAAAAITAPLYISCALANEDNETLSKMKMGSVTTDEGFKYFSGYYDRNEFPTNFITIYTYKNIGGGQKLRIIGNTMDQTFSIFDIDAALSFYRSLVLKKWKRRAQQRNRP